MNYEILDHNIVPDSYVTYIVDLWDGERKDPATSVYTYIGVWRGDDLENEEQGAFDPDFSKAEDSYGHIEFRRYNPRPLLWKHLDTPTKGNDDAKQHRDAHERLTEQNGYTPPAWRLGASSYEQFLAAIDTVAENYEDEEAWKIIDSWRERQLRHDERG